MTVAVTFLVGSISADELILKEGKTIQGKITHEDEEEYTIRMGKLMVLRVPKESVVEVKRDHPEELKGPIIRLIQPPKHAVATSTPTASATPAVSVAVPSPTAPVTNTPTKAPEVVNLKNESHNDQREIKHIAIEQITVFTNLVLTTPDAKVKIPRAVWVVDWKEGEAKTEEGKKKWATADVHATITVIVPMWKPTGTPSAEDAETWNKFIADIGARNEGQIRIYSESLDNFAEALAQLCSPSDENLISDSVGLFEEMKSHAERRQQGFLRRRKKPV